MSLDMNVAQCIEVDNKVNNVINKVHSLTYSVVASKSLDNEVMISGNRHRERLIGVAAMIPPQTQFGKN